MTENGPFVILNADAALLRAVDGACGEAAKKGGAHIACRPGCTQCCMGVFPISQADALRLARGLAALAPLDPDRADPIRERARRTMAALAQSFPGDPETGVPDDGEDGSDRLATLDEACPALDPATGLCDLYEARPLTCRMFGPAIRNPSGAVGVCELCFEGASEDAIEKCAVDLDAEALEAPLLEAIESGTGKREPTIVAAVLAAD